MCEVVYVMHDVAIVCICMWVGGVHEYVCNMCVISVTFVSVCVYLSAYYCSYHTMVQ